MTNAVSLEDLPSPGSTAARIDVRARLRIFDFEGSLAASGRAAWEAL
ncbi:chemotaxis protein, partial [Escherichia coli]|nr:chemotaxis protein [Escherichia coli]